MEHADYVYTEGMTDAALRERLRSGNHGVLALADTNDAYAVPLHYHYDGDRLLFRMSEHDENSEKQQFLRSTERATFVSYEASNNTSWSIHIQGTLRKEDTETDEAKINELFPPFHLFDETIEDIEFVLYTLQIDTAVGRKTIG